jgi:uroporphyrinogen-III synthase
MPDPLSQLRVLVTRPEHQSQVLLDQLRQAGATPVALPLIQIDPISADDPGFHEVKQHFLDLDLYQQVIFVSPNAAHLGSEWIDQYWPQLPLGVNWYAIGNKTAATLNNYGIDAYHNPLGYDSEALLCAPALQQIEGDRVLIVRGSGGRAMLADELRARGAQVSYAELYKRNCPDYAPADVLAALSPAPQAVLISSGEGLDNLQQLMQRAGSDIRSLKSSLFIVPSDRVKGIAKAYGLDPIKTASGPDDQAMITALKQSNTFVESDR